MHVKAVDRLLELPGRIHSWRQHRHEVTPADQSPAKLEGSDLCASDHWSEGGDQDREPQVRRSEENSSRCSDTHRIIACTPTVSGVSGVQPRSEPIRRMSET